MAICFFNTITGEWSRQEEKHAMAGDEPGSCEVFLLNL